MLGIKAEQPGSVGKGERGVGRSRDEEKGWEA